MNEEWHLLLDQNLRYEIKEELLLQGYDALHTVDIGLSHALDPEILDVAIAQHRTLVTLDSDFGDMKIFPLPLFHPGVIRLKIKTHLPSVILPLLKHFWIHTLLEKMRIAL